MAVDLPAPSGPVRMLHGTRVVSAAISLAVFDARARVLVGSTDGRFHAALWSFGLVALTALRRVLPLLLVQQQKDCSNLCV